MIRKRKLMRKFSFDRQSIRFGLLLVYILGCWFLGRLFQFDIDLLQTKFSGVSFVWSSCGFVFLYVVSTTFVWFGPKDVLRVLGALLFGGLVSTIFVCIAELLNAFILFFLSRNFGRDFVEAKFHLHKKTLDTAQEDKGFLGWLALRVNPLIPFRLLDLGAGLSHVSFSKYFIACLIVSPVRIFWLQYIIATLGRDMLKNPTQMLNALAQNSSIIRMSAFYFLLVLVLTLVAIIQKVVLKKAKV